MIEQLTFGCKNKNTIITGAAGQIGKVIAEVFAMQCSNLILVDINETKDSLQALAEQLSKEYGIEVNYYTVDLRVSSDVKGLAQILCEKFKCIDILVNNAGINKLVPALKVEEADWDDIVDTNMKGTFMMSQSIAKLMMKGKEGAIINISSQHGEVGNENRAPYCASKAGIINLTRALSIEWAKYNIRVNCVSPTFVIHEKNESYLNDPTTSKKLLRSIPLGRYCTPIDVAKAVLFLSSPMAGMITGHNMIVDGGYTAQ